MIGDVDRILPSYLTLPDGDAELSLKNLVIGTRLHRNEGMLVEVFTFGGQVTVCLGWDSHCVERETVEGILAEVRRVAEEVAAE